MLLVGVFWAIFKDVVENWLNWLRRWIDALLVMEMVESRVAGRRRKDMFKDVFLKYFLDQSSRPRLRFIVMILHHFVGPISLESLRLCF
jgi:hypothetical protein